MVTIISCDEYSDNNGNRIIGKISNCKVIFKGKNSVLKVGDGFRAYGENTTIVVEDYCNIVLGNSFQVGRQSNLFFRTGSNVRIGNHASLGNQVNIYCRGIVTIDDYLCMREYSELRVHGKLIFDSWVYLQHHVVIYVPRHSMLSVGKDTGFSWYTKIIAGSGHSTFDMRHGLKLEELISEKNNDKHLILGNHVWVGCGSMIHNEVSIGDGCVVSSGSIVTSGTYENNSMIAGNPAKVIARDIRWDRRPDLSFEEYIKYLDDGVVDIKRPSFFDEYSDSGIADDYYMKDDYFTPPRGD